MLNEEGNLGTEHENTETNSAHEPRFDYVAAADQAKDQGNAVLAMHLYLTAYEQCAHEEELEGAVSALRQAWNLALQLKERSIAEYIFEKIEPSLDGEEAQEYARNLQNLALDKLTEFGISRADLEDMADMISDEIGSSIHIAQVTPITKISAPAALQEASLDASAESAETADAPAGSVNGASQQGKASAEAAKASMVNAGKDAKKDASAEEVDPVAAIQAGISKLIGGDGSSVRVAKRPRFAFKDLVGFDGVVEDLRVLGIGVKNDKEMQELIDTLRAQHGLEGLSANGCIVFRTSSREDASTVMAATAGELNLPTMRVQMQPGPQGMPVLSVSMSADQAPKLGNRMMLESPSVLVLEDLDLWGEALIEAASSADPENQTMMNMARSAREAASLIGTAIMNPDIYVLVSLVGEANESGFLYDMLDPMDIVDIYLPDEIERRQIWDKIAQDHPSIRHLSMSQLTRLSRNMSRFDIVSAAREAVEHAYKLSLRNRTYVAVSQDLMFEHLANYQPLESDEYKALEDSVASAFRYEISELESQLDDASNADDPVQGALDDSASLQDLQQSAISQPEEDEGGDF